MFPLRIAGPMSSWQWLNKIAFGAGVSNNKSAKAVKPGDIVLGSNSTTGGNTGNNILIGSDAIESSGQGYSVAIGYNINDHGTGGFNVCLGSYVDNTATNAVIIGDSAVASGYAPIAIGESAQAYFDDSIAIGDVAVANAQNSIAIGGWSTAQGNDLRISVHPGGTNVDRNMSHGLQSLYLHTSDATATPMQIQDSNAAGAPLGNGNAVVFKGLVTCYSTLTLNSAAWEVIAVVNRTGTPTLNYSNVTQLYNGMTGGSIAIGVDTVNNLLTITATGLASDGIEWTASLHFVSTK